MSPSVSTDISVSASPLNSSSRYHPKKINPSLVGASSSNGKILAVYVSGLTSLLTPPSNT